MFRSIRYHLDHDLNRSKAIDEGLRLVGIDATVSRRVGLDRASDEGHIEFARREGRVIVTHDADFLAIARLDPEHSGIIRCRQGELSTGDIMRGLVFIWECCTPEEMTGSIIFLNRGLIDGL